MNEKNFNWDDLKLFLAVARAGGLSGAASVTGKSPPTLARRMLALEETTGEELFRRLPRGYELTEAGSTLLDKAIGLEAQIVPIGQSSANKPSFLVKVSAGSWMTHALCQRVADIVPDDDSVRLRFISSEQVLDISHRETIIGIRNQRPHQGGLACRKIGLVQFAGYATSKTIKPWVSVMGNTPSARWLAGQNDQKSSIEVTSPRNGLDLAIAGVARTVLPTFIGDHQSELERVVSPIADLEHDQWLVAHADERFRPEVRNTIDRLYNAARSLHRGSVRSI